MPSARAVGALAAEILINRMTARRVSVLLPTGRTPLPFYAALREQAARRRIPPSRAQVFQLDEYCGLAPGDPRRYRAYLERELAGTGIQIIRGFDADAADLRVEAERYDRLLDETEVDLAVVGIGRDGHVAFNEPGSPAISGARVVQLSESTRRAAVDEFGALDEVPTRALTVGMRTLLEAREVLLLVAGASKGDVLRAALTGAARAELPASLLRLHPRVTILCDDEAAARLPQAAGADSERALVVLGHRDPDSRRHRASRQSFARLAVAARIARRTPARAAVLTGYTSTGGLSEAEQMAEEWNVPGVPVILEVAGRDTAENATRSLPLVLAIGGIRHVTVVTSAWHLRARRLFAPFRDAGLEVTMRYDWKHGPWLRMLSNEIRLMRAYKAKAGGRAGPSGTFAPDEPGTAEPPSAVSG